MATGIVRFYNDSKGFGMITPDTGGPAIFANAAEIKSAGAKKLKARQRVEYDLRQSAEGDCAANIRIA